MKRTTIRILYSFKVVILACIKRVALVHWPVLRELRIFIF
jgi:hypothetical protein